jgi:hypothetical protein
MLMPVKLNSFTHRIALLVLHDRDILAHATSVSGLDYFHDKFHNHGVEFAPTFPTLTCCG